MQYESYEWDEDKRRSNLDKHEVDFEAIYEFDWDNAVTEPSPRDNELRYIAISYLGNRLYTVIYTERGDRRRIISLRKPSRSSQGYVNGPVSYELHSIGPLSLRERARVRVKYLPLSTLSEGEKTL